MSEQETYTAADLEDAVARLKEAREAQEKIELTYYGLTKAFEDDYADVIANRMAARKVTDYTAEHVREVALAVWEAGDQASKTLRPGIGIRETPAVEYDPGAAFAWAKASGLCLQLDTRKFESLAQNDVAGVLPEALAKVKKVAMVTIGKELP